MAPHGPAAAVLLVWLALAATPVAAQTVLGESFRDSVTIPAEDHAAFTIALSPSEEVKFSVQVTTGGDIDVYFTNQAGYSDYVNPDAPEFYYFVKPTKEQVSSFSNSFHPNQTGTYYIVLDNAYITDTGAMPTGPVVVALEVTKAPYSPFGVPEVILYPLVGAAIGVTVAGVTALVRRRRAAQAGLPPGPMLLDFQGPVDYQPASMAPPQGEESPRQE